MEARRAREVCVLRDPLIHLPSSDAGVIRECGGVDGGGGMWQHMCLP